MKKQTYQQTKKQRNKQLYDLKIAMILSEIKFRADTETHSESALLFKNLYSVHPRQLLCFSAKSGLKKKYFSRPHAARQLSNFKFNGVSYAELNMSALSIWLTGYITHAKCMYTCLFYLSLATTGWVQVKKAKTQICGCFTKSWW